MSRYIVIPARAAAGKSKGKEGYGRAVDLKESKPGTAGMVEVGAGDAGMVEGHGINGGMTKVLGTGGTAPVEFLKQVRDETRDAVELSRMA